MVQLVLTGDENNVAMPMTDAEVNHLRRLLAWVRLEHSLGEEMMIGYLEGAQKAVAADPSCQPKAQEIIDERIAKIASVPAYVRQAVKMLTKAVRDHDAETRVVEPTPERP